MNPMHRWNGIYWQGTTGLINNRQQQAGRRRGRNGNGGGNNGGGGPRQGGQGRPDNGNRIDNRARGNANQLYEKYKNLAADAQRQGDRVNTEYYLQFADHYFRVLSDQRGRTDEQPQRRPSQDFDGDDDYGDEGEPIRAGEQGDAPRQERFERQERQDRPRDNRRNDMRSEGGERPRRWEQRDDRNARTPDRADAVQNDEPTGYTEVVPTDQPVAESPLQTEVAGQHRAEPVAAGESLEQRAETILNADAPLAPRRRGRPRREAAPVAEATTESNGVDADRLPPSLTLSAAEPAAEGDAPKPRRRRVRSAVTDDAPAS
jgi:hypothetical protein